MPENQEAPAAPVIPNPQVIAIPEEFKIPVAEPVAAVPPVIAAVTEPVYEVTFKLTGGYTVLSQINTYLKNTDAVMEVLNQKRIS